MALPLTCLGESPQLSSVLSAGAREHLPFKRVFAFGPEVVHVGLEMQLEHVIFVDVLGFRGDGECSQAEAGWQGGDCPGKRVGGGCSGEAATGVEPARSLSPYHGQF